MGDGFAAIGEPDVGLHHDTLDKVNKGLRASGLTEQQAIDAITQMQNEGVLFRERVTGERSMVDEIMSTPQGRAAMRFASENCDLRELLDLAHRIISEGQNASLTDIQAFAKGYTLDLGKR